METMPFPCGRPEAIVCICLLYTSYWRASYKAIEDANRFIRGVETGPFYNEENTAVMQMLGEAKCLRAMVYHDLVWL